MQIRTRELETARGARTPAGLGRLRPLVGSGGRELHIPAVDLLLVAGDFCPPGPAGQQRFWVDREFRTWLGRQDAHEIVGVAGNCDLIAAADRDLMGSLPWTYLENEARRVLGHTVFGSPLALPFGAWPFMATDERLAEVWAQIPEETELLLVHGPPHGLGDLTLDGVHAGSLALRERINKLPALRDRQ